MGNWRLWVLGVFFFNMFSLAQAESLSQAGSLCNGDQVNRPGMKAMVLGPLAEGVTQLSGAEQQFHNTWVMANRIKRKLGVIYKMKRSIRKSIRRFRLAAWNAKGAATRWRKAGQMWTRQYKNVQTCVVGLQYAQGVAKFQKGATTELKVHMVQVQATGESLRKKLKKYGMAENKTTPFLDHLIPSAVAQEEPDAISEFVADLFLFLMYESLADQLYENYRSFVSKGVALQMLLELFGGPQAKGLFDSYRRYFYTEFDEIVAKLVAESAEEDGSGITEEEDKKINPRETEF